MRDDELRLLRRLRESEHGVTESSIGKGCQNLVDRLQDCGAGKSVIGKSNRGRRIVIADFEAFEKFVTSYLPQGLDFDYAAVDSHASAVAFRADAKVFAGAIAEGVFLRATQPGIFVHSVGGEFKIPVSQLTQVASCAAISITDENRWSFGGTIAVVENADAFWQHHIVLPDVDLVIYAAGRMSTRLINWLASPPMKECPITHWGDYDPVGVAEYLRLLDACGPRVATFVPSRIDELIETYGKRKLVRDNVKTLEKLRTRRSNANVCRMVELFDKYHRGLEQEILLHGPLWPDAGAGCINHHPSIR